MIKELFTVTSNVIRGVGMGRKIGFPTINLVYPEHSDFETGVYACRVSFPDSRYLGVMHLGPRHTFDNVDTFEVFLLNFENREMYGTEAMVEVFHKLRDIEKFKNPDELVKQIEKDIVKAGKFFKRHELCS